MLRVDTGLLSVQVKKSTHKYLSKEQIDQHHSSTSPRQQPDSLSIVMFTGDQILKIRECGDQQCLLKLSPDEVHQVIAQNLHTNLPQKTDFDDTSEDADIDLVGPVAMFKIGLVSSSKLSDLTKIKLNSLDEELRLIQNIVWVNSIRFEVPRQLLRVEEVSVVKEPAFIATKLVDLIDEINCRGAQCLLTRTGIELFSVDPQRSKIKLKIKLKRGVTVRGTKKGRSVVTQTIPLRRCSILTPQVPVLGGIKQHKILLAIARGCGAGKYRSISVSTWPPTKAHIRQEFKVEDPSWRYFELLVQETPSQGDQLEVSLVRQQRQEVLLGQVTIALKHSYQPKQIRLKIDRLGKVDFIPTNQKAQLTLAYDESSWLELLTPKSYVGFYSLEPSLKAKSLNDQYVKEYATKADQGASGQVPLLISYVPTFQSPFQRFNQPKRELATFRTEARYTLRRVNTPIILTESAQGEAVVDVSCFTNKERSKITPRKVFLIPFESRHSCRVTIHKDRIPKWAGKQHIIVTEDREKFKRVVTASHGVGDIVIAIPVKKSQEFDRLEIGVGHNYSSAQYDFAPQQDLGAESRYEVVLGDRTFGVSLSTSLPTGLFRYGFNADDRSSVALSAGGLGRLLWLWREGRPFPVGIDFGMLVTGIDGEPHLSFIGGIGVSVPVLNANTPFEASFNLHAWLEYAPTRVDEGMSPWSLLFGPSFAVGKFSTNL